MTEYKIVYKATDGIYKTIDQIFSEDSAYIVLTMVIKAGYEDARIEACEAIKKSNVFRKQRKIFMAKIMKLLMSR